MWRKIRLLAFILAFIIMSAVITSCGGMEISQSESRQKISVIVKMKDADFFSVVHKGALAASKEFGVDIIYNGPENEKDIDKQISLVEDAITNSYNAIVLAASDYNKLSAVVEKAANQNIPVIIIDSQLNSDRTKGFIGTDNFDAGTKLAETLVKRVGEKCQIAVMNFMKGAASSDMREKGVYNTLDKYTAINVIANMYCNSDEEIAYDLTNKLVEQNKNLNAIICTNAQSTVGVARSINDKKLAGKIKIIGLDSTPEEVSLVENKVIDALVIQNPFNMGYLGVKYAIEAINNKSVPQYTYTGLTIIDKDNMYLPENEKLVFPFSDN